MARSHDGLRYNTPSKAPEALGTLLRQGTEAFSQGVRRSANPCAHASVAWDDWMDDWDHAESRLRRNAVTGTPGVRVHLAKHWKREDT